MKRERRFVLLSWLAAGCAFGLLFLFSLAVYTSQRYANQLQGRNDAERTLNLLLSTVRAERRDPAGRPPAAPQTPERGFFSRLFRDVEEFEQVLRDNPVLAERMLGIGLYAEDGAAVFRYGLAPPGLRQEDLTDWDLDYPRRHYSFDPARKSLRIVQAMFDPRFGRPRETDRPALLSFEILVAEHWSRESALLAVFLAWSAGLLVAIWVMRMLAARNIDYRRKISEQRQLVALGSAARTLAHEIKNPLSAIRLQTDLIARLCPSGVDRELGIVNQELERLKVLTDRVGDFLRDPAGAPAPTGLAAFVRETVARMAPGVPVEAAEVSDGAKVLIDPARFRSAVENLVRNALESGAGEEGVSVKVSRSREGLAIEVLDRGAGLPVVEVDSLFDPFFTTKSSGSGIGLAVAKRFVEAAGGSLSLANREGGGAAARIALPVLKE